MEPDEAKAYVEAFMAEFMPILRAAIAEWERLDLMAPPPEELAQLIVKGAFGMPPQG